jgi:nicotinamide phosphoribosyltransferase
MFNPTTLIDGYKLDHRRQYPAKTEYVYSNWTPRGSRTGQKEVVFFGLQYFLDRYLGEEWEKFFTTPKEVAAAKYKRRVDGYLGPNEIGTEHIEALWDLGYLPLRFKALPEGSLVPLRVPMLTVENTHPDFAWLVNYFETLMSSVLWMPCTSATTAYTYRRTLEEYAERTGSPKEFVDWQGHDFSFRGMAGPEAAAMSGAGHLLSFTGTDTIPAIDLLEDYYDGASTFVGGSVAATEHSVMCAGGDESEQETFQRLIDLYPAGILSVVSDTWDLWKVLTVIVPNLKDQILARDGKLVIRPDSGDPVKIICGDPEAVPGTPAFKGVIELLWGVFGGTETDKGYKILDAHVGAIYGDSITLERLDQILFGLMQKGFASANMVFGVGSFTYQYTTRDTYGFAMKSTWVQIDGVGREIFKNPVTDDGLKKSAKGRIAVIDDHTHDAPHYVAIDQQDSENPDDELHTVWLDGKFVKRYNVDEVRSTLRKFL